MGATPKRVTSKKSYFLYSAGIIVLFMYLLFTEVWDRSSALLALSREVAARESLAVAPESLLVRKNLLVSERAELLWSWNGQGKKDHPPRSESALYSYLERSASEDTFTVLSIEPLASSTSSSRISEVTFKVHGRSAYHNLGRFLWHLETKIARIRIDKVSLKRPESVAKSGEGFLDVTFEGHASIVRDV